MRHMLNTLFVMTENAYAALDGENVIIKVNEEEIGRYPLHILEGIFLFTYSGASPALMGKCVEKNINLVFMSPSGRFLARIVGESHGNVLLRRMQYRIADDPKQSSLIARNMIYGKISNNRHVLDRTRRDHPHRIDLDDFVKASEQLKGILSCVVEENSLEELRGYEGSAAKIYFDRFDSMILQNKDTFYFSGRNRRPPLDNVNALLSYVYSLLSSDCSAALEMVGMDSFVGFMHKDRPGRQSLALDLMEEMRSPVADRFVLTLINDRKISNSDFEKRENGSVLLTKEGRRKVQKEWQARKQEKITHPYLKEKIEWGLIPYVQALLLARYIRGDLDGYPPFIWK